MWSVVDNTAVNIEVGSVSFVIVMLVNVCTLWSIKYVAGENVSVVWQRQTSVSWVIWCANCCTCNL
jgi:hypothetical protein